MTNFPCVRQSCCPQELFNGNNETLKLILQLNYLHENEISIIESDHLMHTATLKVECCLDNWMGDIIDYTNQL